MNRKERALAFVNEEYSFTVTGRSVSVTDTMKDYAIEKISKIERISKRIIDVYVTMDIQKLSHRVDIILKVGDFTVKSHAETTDMYASIDMAVHKIEAQLRKYKTKLENHHAKGIPAIDMVVNVVEPNRNSEIVEVNEMIEEENRRKIESTLVPHKIISQEKYSLKTLNREEAIMKMELSLDPFLIFRLEEDQKIKVIYRREDDNYAIVEVEDPKADK